MWDTGLGDKLAANANGVDSGGVHMQVPVRLVDQLGKLGLAPGGCRLHRLFAFSFRPHGQRERISQLDVDPQLERDQLGVGYASAVRRRPQHVQRYKTAKTKMIDGDFDMFGDGSVRILKTPGHTPGHQVLALKLAKSGTVILSGDLYHLRDNRAHRRVPSINYERADTLASIDRIEKIVKNTKARLVVQHDPADFKALPEVSRLSRVSPR